MWLARLQVSVCRGQADEALGGGTVGVDCDATRKSVVAVPMLDSVCQHPAFFSRCWDQ